MGTGVIILVVAGGFMAGCAMNYLRDIRDSLRNIEERLMGEITRGVTR